MKETILENSDPILVKIMKHMEFISSQQSDLINSISMKCNELHFLIENKPPSLPATASPNDFVSHFEKAVREFDSHNDKLRDIRRHLDKLL